MGDDEPTPCPSCAAPLAIGGTFCKRCGYDAAHAEGEDAHLDGVDLPQGYAADDPSPAAASPDRRAGRKEWLVTAAVLAAFAALGLLAKLTS